MSSSSSGWTLTRRAKRETVLGEKSLREFSPFSTGTKIVNLIIDREFENFHLEFPFFSLIHSAHSRLFRFLSTTRNLLCSTQFAFFLLFWTMNFPFSREMIFYFCTAHSLLNFRLDAHDRSNPVREGRVEKCQLSPKKIISPFKLKIPLMLARVGSE